MLDPSISAPRHLWRLAVLLSTLALAPGLWACDGGAEPDPDAGSGTDAATGADGGGADGGLTEGCARSTESGEVIGIEGTDHCAYLGIPYVAPPVGEQRLRAPAPHPGWSEPLAADTRGPVCLQREGSGAEARLIGEEDCLSLNLWSPKTPGPHPVMVFIHGGAFIQGAGNLELYDGATFARAAGAVVVTFNYRIGALGFLATDELIAESGDGGAGNYGLLDQAAALRWVQANVAAFGGDPAQVTLFGESAGAVSVCAQLGAPSSDGLFARAIIESGGGCSQLPALSSAPPGGMSAVERSAAVVDTAGCAGDGALACLRALPAEDLAQALYDAGGMSALGLPDMGPNIDGAFLPAQPFARIAAGEADLPVIIGSNADESTIFLLGFPVPTEMAYQNLVRGVAPAIADELLALYPVAAYDSPKDAYEHLFSDLGFICPALSLAQAASAGAPAYTYHLTHTLGGVAGSIGAFHGLELFLLFSRFDQLPVAYSPSEADLRVGEDMREAWSLFANGEALSVRGTDWPATTEGEPQIMVFDDPSAVQSEIREGRCARLRELGAVP